jgi:hypothetical protein
VERLVPRVSTLDTDMAPAGTATPGLVKRLPPGRLSRWRQAFQASHLETPWRVGPLVALAEPAVAVVCAVVILLLALRAGLRLSPEIFVAAALGMALAGNLVGRHRAGEAFRRWARIAAELPFPIHGADRLLRRPTSRVRMEIRFEVPLPVEGQLLRPALTAAAVPGVAVMLLTPTNGSAAVIADGPAWLTAWAVRRLLIISLAAFHEAFPVARVDLCPPMRHGPPQG